MFSFSTIFSACGVTMGANDEAYFPNKAKEEAFLHTLSDGTSSQHYSYAIFAVQLTDTYNLQEGRLTLTVYEEAKDGSLNAVQHITVPYGANINKQGKKVYFIGCLRPRANKIDMDDSGFYEIYQTIKNTGYLVYESELCEKLRTIHN